MLGNLPRYATRRCCVASRATITPTPTASPAPSLLTCACTCCIRWLQPGLHAPNLFAHWRWRCARRSLLTHWGYSLGWRQRCTTEFAASPTSRSAARRCCSGAPRSCFGMLYASSAGSCEASVWGYETCWAPTCAKFYALSHGRNLFCVQARLCFPIVP